MSVDLAIWFVCQNTEVSEDHPPFYRGDAMHAAELLFPMLELFQGGVGEKLKEIAYSTSAEPEVDAMLEAMAQNPMDDNRTRTSEASRVLMERLKQSLVVLGANAAENKSVLIPTQSLPQGYRQVAIALLWLHEMVLPFEPGTVLPPMRQRH